MAAHRGLRVHSGTQPALEPTGHHSFGNVVIGRAVRRRTRPGARSAESDFAAWNKDQPVALPEFRSSASHTCRCPTGLGGGSPSGVGIPIPLKGTPKRRRPLRRNDFNWIGRAGCVFFRKSVVVRSLRARFRPASGPLLATASPSERIRHAVPFPPIASSGIDCRTPLNLVRRLSQVGTAHVGAFGEIALPRELP